MKGIRVTVIGLALLALVSAGCSSTSYHRRLADAPAKPRGYPIPVYSPDMRVPRPTDVMGTVTVHAGKFTMFGGDSTVELAKVMKHAYEKGADAVKITDIEKPDFANPNYRMTVDLLRYSEVWERMDVSEKALREYLDARPALDPIEGIWSTAGHSVGILRSNAKPGREFIGIIFNSGSLAWPDGTKKMDIRRGLEPGSYIITYYLEDFERREIPIILAGKRSFRINMPKDEEDRFILYTKD